MIWELERFFPKAQIILATTIPMNPVHPETINPRTTEGIMEYNRVVKEVAQEQGLPVNDLFEESKDWGEEFYLDYCHLVGESYQRLAKKLLKLFQPTFNQSRRNTLCAPPKSEFVEKVRKIKSLLFRHFIYVNLGPQVRALPVAGTAGAQSVP